MRARLSTALKEKMGRVRERLSKMAKGSLEPQAKQLDRSYLIELVGIPKELFSNATGIAYTTPSTIGPLLIDWNKTGKKGESFHDFLRRKGLSDADKINISMSTLEYFSKEERKKYAVSFQPKAEASTQESSSSLNIPMIQGHKLARGTYIFVLDPTGTTLYIAKKIKGELQHSSFLAGGAVGAAGLLVVGGDDGAITHICNSSGHYKPTAAQEQNLIQFLQHPDRLGEAGTGKISFGREPYRQACRALREHVVAVVK